MKSIELKTVKETVSINGTETDQEFKTIELIKGAVNQQPAGGFDFQDMTDRLRILGALEKVNGDAELQLEDKDYENLIKYVKQTKWGVLSKTIVEFINTFEK